MRSVRETISTYPFLFDNARQQARILTGTEEATFSWIAVNYLSGLLGVCVCLFVLVCLLVFIVL